MRGSKGPSKILKKAKQSTLQEPGHEHRHEQRHEPAGGEQIVPHEAKLEPIKDKHSYDRFVKTIALRIYHVFETSLREEGAEQPEVSLVGFDVRRVATLSEQRMSDYVALNARMIVEKAFVDLPEYAARHMPRVAREMARHGGALAGHVENKVRHDIMMEIRALAMLHIPEEERYRYISKLKEL